MVNTFTTRGVRVAVEGCGHGTLHAIYAAVKESCKARRWDGVDLLIIGGDFQATRNAADLAVMSVPAKYRAMADFHAYYSGARVAPYLTVFVGGNHEAAGYLWELFYGGWVAPRIYYWGAANVLRVGPLRIAGLSGIWKGFDYRKPHHERLPFSQDDVKSFYHVREIDVRKLLLLRSPVDVGLSHDWPRAIEHHGDAARLFRMKPLFRSDSQDGTLGSPAAEYVMDRLRPRYWFSAHLHCKFSAIKQYGPPEGEKPAEPESAESAKPAVKMDLPPPVNASLKDAQATANPDEIDLDDDDDDAGVPVAEEPKPAKDDSANSKGKEADLGALSNMSGVSSELLAQLPASFTRPQTQPQHQSSQHPRQQPGQPVPPTITNTTVRFLALDKCLPGRHFLQLCEIEPTDTANTAQQPPPTDNDTDNDADTVYPGRYRLEYDPEWLAITRVLAPDLIIGDPSAHTPPDRGEAHYAPLIAEARAWVDEHIVQRGRLAVPDNFAPTAPAHAPIPGRPETWAPGQPDEYTNPQTAAFCALVGVPNLWDASAEEREARKQQGPAPSVDRRGGGGGGGYRGGHGGRGGGGHGGGRGGGRGRGRGRGWGRW